ncbi:MptD family putative ECF transporter S component [Actinomyces gerencseriae]|uniref:MptD family putative ECF transporter S component n=1 Tax=Actinomyces gerencseriae TaxID=52769 RepID=UPI0028E3B907|nr:MptD family putative ECF transporter S component [Actinomyces gerencseriae]
MTPNTETPETPETPETSEAPAAASPAPLADHSLKPKDLITVGVFTAMYFVVFFGFGMLGLFGPAVHAIGIVLGSLANGIVFALYITRIRKPGMIFLTGIISSLLMVLTGHAWTTLVTAAVFSILAEIVLARGRYRSARASALAYGVFSLWVAGPILPLYYQHDAYIADIGKKMGDGYARAWETLFSPAFLLGLLAVVFVSSFLGGRLGQKMLRKHFMRAGIA